jgi:hypothetical protein
MRKLIPFLDVITPPAKPSTQKRFESVFATLTLMLQVWGVTFGAQLVGILGALYNRIATSLYGDPSRLKSQLIYLRQYWINYLRGGLASAELHKAPDAHSDPKKTYIYDIITLRDKISDTMDTATCQLFDAIVFAVCSFDRLMTYTIPADYTTITSERDPIPANTVDPIQNIHTHLEALGITMEAFKAEYKRRCRAQKHLILSTAGVNGPATWTAHSDARALIGNTSMYKVFAAFCEQSQMFRFVQDLLGTVRLPSYDTTSDDQLHLGRIHSIAEWGGKNRLVAIVDYWTQLVLTPLHDTIFHFLAKIPSDGTFDQERLADRVKAMTADPSLSIYSYDLSAATDRLPIELQERVLSALLGSSLASLWRRLLVNRDYITQDGDKLRYAVGQPMGAKSSWAMLALTHHVIVQQAAYTTGASDYQDYALLGDDITLTGSTVAENYRHIMSYYGVKINLTKSITPIANALNAAEICKRVFVNGVEISALPVKLIAKTVMNGRLAAQLQNIVTSRLLSLPHRCFITWISGLVDKESLRFITILNMLSSDFSGILHPQVTPITDDQMERWYPKSGAKPQDIKQAYTYIAVVEQLKRLDTLLRQTQIIQAAIETNAFGYHTQRIGDLGWQYADPDHDIKLLAASMPKFTATHPIVKASTAEVDRVGDLLSALRVGDKDTTSQARSRLLDMFRNALVDAWADKAAAVGQADRSLVQRALTTMSDIALFRPAKRDQYGNIISRAHHLSFTVMLAYLNRMWTVDWTLGTAVEINSVKSKVLQSRDQATGRFSEIYDLMDLGRDFSPGRKGQVSASDSVAAPKTRHAQRLNLPDNDS